MNLITPRPVPGVIGYWEGEQTPYNDPSPLTELWTVHDLYPYMNVYNPPITGKDEMISAGFWITPFTYRVIEDKNKIMQFLRGDKSATIRTMGDGKSAIKAPNWMITRYKQYMVQPGNIREVGGK